MLVRATWCRKEAPDGKHLLWGYLVISVLNFPSVSICVCADLSESIFLFGLGGKEQQDHLNSYGTKFHVCICIGEAQMWEGNAVRQRWTPSVRNTSIFFRIMYDFMSNSSLHGRFLPQLHLSNHSSALSKPHARKHMHTYSASFKWPAFCLAVLCLRLGRACKAYITARKHIFTVLITTESRKLYMVHLFMLYFFLVHAVVRAVILSYFQLVQKSCSVTIEQTGSHVKKWQHMNFLN